MIEKSGSSATPQTYNWQCVIFSFANDTCVCVFSHIRFGLISRHHKTKKNNDEQADERAKSKMSDCFSPPFEQSYIGNTTTKKRKRANLFPFFVFLFELWVSYLRRWRSFGYLAIEMSSSGFSLPICFRHSKLFFLSRGGPRIFVFHSAFEQQLFEQSKKRGNSNTPSA